MIIIILWTMKCSSGSYSTICLYSTKLMLCNSNSGLQRRCLQFFRWKCIQFIGHKMFPEFIVQHYIMWCMQTGVHGIILQGHLARFHLLRGQGRKEASTPNSLTSPSYTSTHTHTRTHARTHARTHTHTHARTQNLESPLFYFHK